MSVILTHFEAEILNKIIPTQTFGNPSAVPMALKGLITERKEQMMANGTSEQDFRTLASQAPKNIFQFLRENEFYYEREGEVFYITEKGKQLRAQGTLEKYVEWRQNQTAGVRKEMTVNEERGYTDKAIKERNEMKVHQESKRKMFPVIVILVVIAAALIAHYLHWI